VPKLSNIRDIGRLFEEVEATNREIEGMKEKVKSTKTKFARR